MSLTENKLNIKNSITTYTKHSKWFAISAILALLLGYLYIRYTVPEFEVTSQIQVVEEKGGAGGLSVFQDLDMFSGTSKAVEDEIEILASRANYIDVVKELRTNIQFKALGNVIDTEVYNNAPFNVNFIAKDSLINTSDFDFIIEFLSNSSIAFSSGDDVPAKQYSFGKAIPTEIGDVIITPKTEGVNDFIGRRYQVLVIPVTDVATIYKEKVEIAINGENSNILDVTMSSSSTEKAKDILNKLIEIYNRNEVEDKKAIADKTSEFINNRIQLISGTLTDVDEDAQEMLTEKGMTGSGLEVGAAVQVSAGSRQNLENARVQLQMVSGFKDYVNQEQGFEEMPVLDVGSGAIADATAKYNQLVAERKRLLQSADEQNPMIVNLDQQLNGLKSTMKSSLNALETNVGMNVSTLQNQLGRIQGTIYSAPKNQRDLRNITRKQETTEALYLYLLQKREESQITFASAAPKSNIIDLAYVTSIDPVRPKQAITYLASLILGLLIPFSVVYAKDLLDTKVHNKHSLEEITKDLPVLGELPFLSKKDSKIIVNDDRSVLAEALRILRANLDFLISTKNEKDRYKNNVVLVTSSVPGEGKTFVSTNLSMILASTNKKVLLVGADIRNPKLYAFFSGDSVDKLKTPERNKDAGLTDYLINDKLSVKDVIKPMLVYNNTIDVIYSGKIPPNPGELLMNTRMGTLIEEVAADYDYVIMDTAPLMVVSDTLLLTKFSNHIIYVTRAGVTDKSAIQFPIDLHEEGKLNGVSFVVNGVSLDNLGYGGQYGYGYGKTTKKWWKF
jgi:capsular exopolysaccharide synthesis family protein